MTKTKRGKNIYIPVVVLDEIKDIQREDDIFGQGEALRKMVKYTRVGREVNRLRCLNWSKAQKQEPFDLNPPKKKWKKRK